MKNILLLSAFALAVLFANAKEDIKIGVILPITGNLASIGEMGRAGVLLALKELPADSHFDYQLVFEDDEFVFSRTAMAVKKLKEIDHADVVITLWGYGSDIALPILKDSPTTLHLNVDRWADGEGHNDFMCGVSMQEHIQKLISLLKNVGYKKVAFIGTAEQGVANLRKKLEPALRENNIELVESTLISSDVRDLRTWILKTAEEKPDVIVEYLQMPTALLFLKQAKELGIQIPIGHGGQGVFEVEPILKEGSWMVYPSSPTQSWQERFQNAYHTAFRYPAPQCYNTFLLLLKGCERLDGTRKPTTQEISESIKYIGNFEGATGALHFAAPNRYEAPVSYYIFRNGSPEPVSLEQLDQTIVATKK